MKCKTCDKKLKPIPQGFDAFSFLSQIEMRYCENKKCSEYGNVTVAGIPEEDINQLTGESLK